MTFESTLILAAAAIAFVGLLFLWVTGLLKTLIPACSICWCVRARLQTILHRIGNEPHPLLFCRPLDLFGPPYGNLLSRNRVDPIVPWPRAAPSTLF